LAEALILEYVHLFLPFPRTFVSPKARRLLASLSDLTGAFAATALLHGWCTNAPKYVRSPYTGRHFPAKHRIPIVEPRGFEPLTSALLRRCVLSGCVLACPCAWLNYAHFRRLKGCAFRLCTAASWSGCCTYSALDISPTRLYEPTACLLVGRRGSSPGESAEGRAACSSAFR
jgi:hypothetical protein